MERIETNPTVRNLSERKFTNYGSIILPLCVIVGLVIIGIIVYLLANQDPDFNVYKANSMVDNVFGFYIEDEVQICDHSVVILNTTGGSPHFARKEDCVRTRNQQYPPTVEANFSYYERSFTCEVSGINLTTQNKFSDATCRYDGDFKIYLSVTNRTRGSSAGGNHFKLLKIVINFEEKTDYSKRLGKMVKAFSWATGEKISEYAKEAFIKNYAHEEYERQDRERFDDLEMCLNFWPCPTHRS